MGKKRKKFNIIEQKLYDFGLRKGDGPFLVTIIFILGPGTLIIISWVAKFLDGLIGDMTGLLNFIDSILIGSDYFIVFLYYFLSTLAAILWWGFLLCEKIFNKNQ